MEKGKVRWTADERIVLVGPSKVTKYVRNGIMADDSGHITITVWSPIINMVKEDVPIIYLRCVKAVISIYPALIYSPKFIQQNGK